MWLKLFPFGSADAGLTEQAGEEVSADVAAVGIWDHDGGQAANHRLVTSPRMRAGEAGIAKGADEVSPADGSKRRHVRRRCAWVLCRAARGALGGATDSD